MAFGAGIIVFNVVKPRIICVAFILVSALDYTSQKRRSGSIIMNVLKPQPAAYRIISKPRISKYFINSNR